MEADKAQRVFDERRTIAPYLRRRRKLCDQAIAVPELANNIELESSRLGKSICVAACLDLVRFREVSLIVETIKPVFRHPRALPVEAVFTTISGGEQNNIG
jgi:hypothetical protein